MDIPIKNHSLPQSQRRIKIETRGVNPVSIRATETQMIEIKDWLCCVPPSLMANSPAWLQDIRDELDIRFSVYRVLDLSA